MPMRVAVAGLGWWGKQIISCLKKSPRFEVVYGVDPIASEVTNGFLADHGVRYVSSLDSVLTYSNVDGVMLALDSGAKRNALKKSGFERPFQARQSRLGMAS